MYVQERRPSEERLLVAAEDRRLALDAHEDREDRRRDDDVAHGDVALLEVADVAELEHHAPGHGADVAPGADDGADAAEALGADVGFCVHTAVFVVARGIESGESRALLGV